MFLLKTCPKHVFPTPRWKLGIFVFFEIFRFFSIFFDIRVPPVVKKIFFAPNMSKTCFLGFSVKNKHFWFFWFFSIFSYLRSLNHSLWSEMWKFLDQNFFLHVILNCLSNEYKHVWWNVAVCQIEMTHTQIVGNRDIYQALYYKIQVHAVHL